MKTDEQLWTEYRAGGQSALAELETRWRKYLLPYVEKRGGAAGIVDGVFKALAKFTGEVDSVRRILFASAHAWTGATCDWRNGFPLYTAESGW
jgi:hypothetical protein